MKNYGITDDEYRSIVELTKDTYIIADRIIDSSYYSVLKIEDLGRLSYDFSSVYDIKMTCRNEQIDFNRLRQENSGYAFFYDIRENANEAIKNIDGWEESISNCIAEFTTPYWLQILKDFADNRLPDSKFQSVIVTIHDGTESFNKGVIEGGIMVMSFCPKMAAYSCTITANALDYDYLYRKAYQEKYGAEPPFFCSLYPGVKASAETYGNLGSLMINCVFDSFITEDGKFNINGTMELLGTFFGGSVTAALGSVDIEVLKSKMEGKIVHAGLKDHATNIDSAYEKVYGNEKLPIDISNAEKITYDSASKNSASEKVLVNSGKDVIKNITQVDYRKEVQKKTGECNVAVFEYIDKDGTPIYIAEHSGGGMHAEMKIINKLRNEGISGDNVIRIYTEREPCVEGKGQGCAQEIDKFCRSAEVTYSFSYGSRAEADAAKKALKEELKKIKWENKEE